MPCWEPGGNFVCSRCWSSCLRVITVCPFSSTAMSLWLALTSKAVGNRLHSDSQNSVALWLWLAFWKNFGYSGTTTEREKLESFYRERRMDHAQRPNATSSSWLWLSASWVKCRWILSSLNDKSCLSSWMICLLTRIPSLQSCLPIRMLCSWDLNRPRKD